MAYRSLPTDDPDEKLRVLINDEKDERAIALTNEKSTSLIKTIQIPILIRCGYCQTYNCRHFRVIHHRIITFPPTTILGFDIYPDKYREITVVIERIARLGGGSETARWNMGPDSSIIHLEERELFRTGSTCRVGFAPMPFHFDQRSDKKVPRHCCEKCNKKGEIPIHGKVLRCTDCDGLGGIRCTVCLGSFSKECTCRRGFSSLCSTCQGAGARGEQQKSIPCSSCFFEEEFGSVNVPV